MRIASIAAAALVVGGLSSPPAFAGLIGDQVDGSYYYGNDTSAGNLVQDAGVITVANTVTFDSISPPLYATIDGSMITLFLGAVTQQFDASAAFNGVVFTDTTSSNITGATLDALTNVTGTAPIVSFTSNTVSVDLSGTFFSANNQQVVVDVATSSPTSTPEPLTLSILATGMIGLGVARRRRSR